MTQSGSYTQAIYGNGNEFLFCRDLAVAICEAMDENENLTPRLIDDCVQFPKSFPRCEQWLQDHKLLSPMMFAYIQLVLHELLGIDIHTYEIDKDVRVFIGKKRFTWCLSNEWTRQGERQGLIIDPGFSWASSIFSPMPLGMKTSWVDRWMWMQVDRAGQYTSEAGRVYRGLKYDSDWPHNFVHYPAYAATFVFCSICSEVQNMLRHQTR